MARKYPEYSRSYSAVNWVAVITPLARGFMPYQHTVQVGQLPVQLFSDPRGGGGGTLGISGWECAAGTLEPLTYTRASSAEFCYPILE